jgi:outer membrane protein OmpA-like peptidoglycan-associated protein
MRMTRLAAALIAAVSMAGCGVHVGVADDKEKPAPKATPAAGATVTPTPAPADDMIEVAVDPLPPDDGCDGRPGVEIPAVDIPEVKTEPISVPDYTLAGHKVPGFVIPGVHIPAQRMPEQCAVREPAPAGCIGAITIPAVTIPAVTIPAVHIPGVSVPGAPQPEQPEVVGNAKVQNPVTQPARHTGRKCRLKVKPGEYQPQVYQPQTYRPQAYRPQVYRPQAYRPQVCVQGDCIPPITVAPITVDPVSVDPVTVAPASIEPRTLPEITSKCVRVLQGGGETAYNVCSDVLFDFDKAEIRPDAEAVLRQVVGSLDKRFAGRAIQVDGHTDSQGSDAYNDSLSNRRAESVKRWLAAHGIAASRIATHGYGESEPVASNATSGGRQRNRRVVIGVSRG